MSQFEFQNMVFELYKYLFVYKRCWSDKKKTKITLIHANYYLIFTTWVIINILLFVIYYLSYYQSINIIWYYIQLVLIVLVVLVLLLLYILFFKQCSNFRFTVLMLCPTIPLNLVSILDYYSLFTFSQGQKHKIKRIINKNLDSKELDSMTTD